MYILATVIAYLVGSIPFGFVIARARGVDIRTVGSGNIGATNVFRILGRTYGILTFVCDVLKGYLPTALLPALAVTAGFSGSVDGLRILCGAGAIAGHNWTCFLGFKGGKGVATSAGVLLGIAPAAIGIGMAAWLAVFLAFRYVSLASMLAAAVIAGAAWVLRPGGGAASLLVPTAMTGLAALVIWRHKGNIQRLLNGTESRFARKQRPAGKTEPS